MEEIAISKFKATSLAILERVRKTRRPILVTKFGEPIAEVVPPTSKPKKKQWLGSMEGTIQIMGDIVAPASDEHDWEVAGLRQTGVRCVFRAIRRRITEPSELEL